MNEEQFNALKYHRIPLDKVIVLTDKDEDEPGKTLLKRPGFEDNYLLETEVSAVAAAAGFLREAIGEDNVKEVGIEGSI